MSLSLAALEHCGVLACVVSVADVVVVNFTAAVSVELRVCAFHQGYTLGCHRSLDHAQELVIVDGAVSVLVEGLEQRLYVDIGEIKAGLLASLGKLLQVESARSVVIHDLEDAANADDRPGTSAEHLLTEGFDQIACPVAIKNSISVRVAQRFADNRRRARKIFKVQ